MPSRADRHRLYHTLAERLEIPGLALALAVIPLVLLPLFLDLPTRVDLGFEIVGWCIFSAFAAELALMLWLAPSPRTHLRERWYDAVVVAAVPPILVVWIVGTNVGFVSGPLRLVRFTRVARSTRLMRVARASRVVALLSRGAAALRWVLVRHGLQYALAIGALIYLGATGLVFLFERDEGNIDNYGEALWWGLATMTALRSESHFPVTPEGRAVAIVVALLGLTLISLITANIAAFLLSSEKHEGSELAGVTEQLNRLERKLDGLHRRESEEAILGSDQSALTAIRSSEP